MPSSSRSSFLIIKVFMRGRVCKVNRANIIASSVMVMLCRYPHLFNLLSELLHLLLKLYKGPTYLISLLRRNALGVRSISLTSHDNNL